MCYEVIIPVSEYINDAIAPSVFFNTYEEAVAYAKPLIDQMSKVVIATNEFEEEREVQYIEIPLDTQRYIENFTTEQTGAVFKNICSYFFDDANLEDLEDDAVKDATENIIARIKEYTKNGE